ncbi:MAG: ABC transporter permease [Firmicutes bacterium]|nr:ABC transporter permease [Bacillota bacterium]
MKKNRSFLRDRAAAAAAVVLLAVILFCVIYPFVSPYRYWEINTPDRYQMPSAKHLFGTDYLGRDLLTRMAWGGRITLSVAFLTGLIAAAAGTAVGILCGYAGGLTDSIGMRIMDAISSVPSLLLAIVFDYLLGMGKGNFLFGIAIAGIPPFARIVRAAVLEIGASSYVAASRALGAGPLHIIKEHVIHNVMPLAAVQATTSVADALTTCTVLGYIGVSIGAPRPEWGMLFDMGRKQLRTMPHLSLIPALAITLCIICLYLVGNGIRDSLSADGGAHER